MWHTITSYLFIKTGNTFDCAEKIYKEFGNDIAAEPVDIDSLDADQLVEAFQEHDALIVGTPTWNTGADEQRSGTGWDEIYYTKLPSMKDTLKSKRVAVFGLGDQSSYSANFADATGELYDVFTSLGCYMIDASWSQEGYEHEASKSIRNDKFCGLVLDMINQEDLTDERIKQWVEQLKHNGILDGSDTSNSVAISSSSLKAEVTITPSSTTDMNTVSSSTSLLLDSPKVIMNGSIQSPSTIPSTIISTEQPVYTGHYNPITSKTMWTSSDGRKSFFTSSD
jgi:flavodoxin I